MDAGSWVQCLYLPDSDQLQDPDEVFLARFLCEKNPHRPFPHYTLLGSSHFHLGYGYCPGPLPVICCLLWASWASLPTHPFLHNGVFQAVYHGYPHQLQLKVRYLCANDLVYQHPIHIVEDFLWFQFLLYARECSGWEKALSSAFEELVLWEGSSRKKRVLSLRYVVPLWKGMNDLSISNYIYYTTLIYSIFI